MTYYIISLQCAGITCYISYHLKEHDPRIVQLQFITARCPSRYMSHDYIFVRILFILMRIPCHHIYAKNCLSPKSRKKNIFFHSNPFHDETNCKNNFFNTCIKKSLTFEAWKKCKKNYILWETMLQIQITFSTFMKR